MIEEVILYQHHDVLSVVRLSQKRKKGFQKQQEHFLLTDKYSSVQNQSDIVDLELKKGYIQEQKR